MIQSIKTQNLRRMQDKEGLILQGCGGSLQEWVDGINKMFTEAGILQDGTKFSNVKSFEHDGLTCLLFSFEDDVKVDIGKLAMWRLQTHATFGGTWLSDYVPNRLGGFVHEDKLSFYGSEIITILSSKINSTAMLAVFSRKSPEKRGRALSLRYYPKGARDK